MIKHFAKLKVLKVNQSGLRQNIYRKFIKIFVIYNYKNRDATIKRIFFLKKPTTMNRLKTQQEKQYEYYNKMNEIYKKESLDFKWFFIIIISALVLTALIENL